MISGELRQKLSDSHKGQHSSPKTEFKKDSIPWNKGGKFPEFSGKNHYNWKGGLSKCLKCGKPLIWRTSKRWCRDCYHQSGEEQLVGINSTLKQQNSKEPTSIEKKLYEELKNRGLLFETQKVINNRFIVDVYIPSLNLVVEADGNYWHSLERTKKRDKAKNAYLTKCGFNLLRLTETEINNGKFKTKLLS